MELRDAQYLITQTQSGRYIAEIHRNDSHDGRESYELRVYPKGADVVLLTASTVESLKRSFKKWYSPEERVRWESRFLWERRARFS